MAHHCPYAEYYHQQAQGGRGTSPYFAGAPYQKGYGLGTFLKGLFRISQPLLRRGAQSLGFEALRAGKGILRDTLTKRTPLRKALASQWDDSSQRMLNQAEAAVSKLVGEGGKRIRKRKRSASAQSSKKRRRVKRTKVTRPRRRRRVGRKTKRTPSKKKGKKTKKKKTCRRKKKAVSFVKRDIFG